MEVKEHVHIIGIGGTGMAPIAKILLQMGTKVSGSDQLANSRTLALESLGARIIYGHDAKNVPSTATILASSAIPRVNPEIVAAQKAKMPVFDRRSFLTFILSERKTIAVSGTHGKTTTTSMLVQSLIAAGISPGYIIGAGTKEEEIPADIGKDPWFVIEADEYGEMFLGLEPSLLIITNVEHDHHDYFDTEEKYWEAFLSAVENTKSAGGTVFICADDNNTKRFALKSGLLSVENIAKPDIASYGLAESAEIKVRPMHEPGYYEISRQRKAQSTTFSVGVPGLHNVKNAAAALLACEFIIGTIKLECVEAIRCFTGSARRMQRIPTRRGSPLYDDYGHHPSEIAATLQALREIHPGSRVLAIWEPHQYTRLEALWAGYGGAFQEADLVIVTEVFSTREVPNVNFDYAQLRSLIGESKTLAAGVRLQEISDLLGQHNASFDVAVSFAPANGAAICRTVSDTL